MSNHRLYRLLVRGLGKARQLPRRPVAAEDRRQPRRAAGVPLDRPSASVASALRQSTLRQSAPRQSAPRQSAPSQSAPSQSIYCVSPELFSSGRVPLRIVGPHDSVTTLETVVTFVGHSTFEIRLNGSVIGFIRRADRSFAARAVPRAGQAHNPRRCLLWDEAARELVRAAGFEGTPPDQALSHLVPMAA